MLEINSLKKFVFLIGLSLIFYGCQITSSTSNIPPHYILGKNNRSIVIGKVKFVDIMGDFKEAILTFVDEETDKVYPIKLGLPARQTPVSNNKVVAEYYFFIELPAGQYSIGELVALHSKFSTLETYLLNANLTIEENSIVYVGTIKVRGLGRTLDEIGPITEAEIIDEHNEVVETFKKEYPQFQDVNVSVKVIDRYQWFKGDHIETNFEK